MAWQFEQMMDLEDASFEEAPTTDMRMMELTKSRQLEVVSMLWMMATDDHHRQGAIIKVTNRFNVSHSTGDVDGSVKNNCSSLDYCAHHSCSL